jgi:hypothetical protein
MGRLLREALLLCIGMEERRNIRQFVVFGEKAQSLTIVGKEKRNEGRQ